MRRYKFYDGSKFVIKQFYYGGPDCSEAIFLVEAWGTYSLFDSSWLVPGATELDYQLSYVTIMPYNQNVANILAARVNNTCPAMVKQKWEPLRKYELFNYVETNYGGFEEGYVIVDRDCLSALDFSLHELQLVRVEERHSHKHSVRALYTGDIHTDRKERLSYRPTGYQSPMVDLKVSTCSIKKYRLKSPTLLV